MRLNLIYTHFSFIQDLVSLGQKKCGRDWQRKNVFPGKKKCITHENDCMLVGFRSAYEMIAYHN